MTVIWIVKEESLCPPCPGEVGITYLRISWSMSLHCARVLSLVNVSKLNDFVISQAAFFYNFTPFFSNATEIKIDSVEMFSDLCTTRAWVTKRCLLVEQVICKMFLKFQ